MTAPSTMVKRRLTVNFQRSVSGGKPQVMEVVVAPLTDPSSPNNDATLVGGRQTQDVLLTNENNPVVFDLVPTDNPDLTDRLTYRIAWREKYMGRQFTQDFVMPDFDCDYDDLTTLGNLIGGETYVQWTDRMRPGGVAGLNQSGQVVDSVGNPVTGAEAAQVVQGNLDAEAVERSRQDNLLRDFFEQFATEQIADVYRTTAENLAFAKQDLSGDDLIEKTARQNADTALAADITGLSNSTDTAIANVQEEIDGINTVLDAKADLVNGYVPTSQLPNIALGHAVVVADQAAMLVLTTDQIQPGDMAVRPDGTFYLNSLPISTLGNWVKLSDAGTVSSVNDQTGDIHLSAADVGARSASVPVPLIDVSGLTTALGNKTDVSATNTLAGRVTAIENDATIVKTSGGVIPHAKQGTDVAFLNVDGQIVNKAGQVINLGGGGGILDITDVTGLSDALLAKADVTDSRFTNARPPTVHAASHAPGQADSVFPVAASAITGLSAILTNNNLTSLSNHGNRINALEAGAGGGGGGSSAKSTWWDGPAATGDFSTVVAKGPFGYNPAHPGADVNGFYYDPTGAAEGEAVYASLTPNGHLKLTVRNESAPADPALATQASLDATNTQVGLRALQTDLTALSTAVSNKANQTSLDTTNTNLTGKASIIQLNSLADVVATKAAQSALDITNNNVATKAAQTDLTALTTTVGTKANQTALDATNTNLALKANQTALDTTNTTVATKAAQTDLTALTTTVGTKANQTALDATNTTVAGHTSALALKADLVGGLVPTGQLPALAYTATVVVSNRGAMLGLTTAQVQPGDICIISTTADKGTYILTATDPSVFTNWTPMPTPDDAVASVNGLRGIVVLGPADVGARSSSVPILQSEVTGLPAALTSKADASALTSGLATKTAPADVVNLISAASQFKLAATLVATTAVASLSGQQSIDGVLAPLGSVVLLTAQSSSAANGLYNVASGAWTRVADMVAGDYFVKGTVVTVSGGLNHHDSFWQETSATGVVGTNANNWIKIMTAGAAPTLTASLGVEKVAITGGSDFRAKVVNGGGILRTVDGLQIDPAVGARKYANDLPASGSNTVTLTHNLNTTDLTVAFREKASGDAVLFGWKPVGVNTISIELDSPPAAGQWRAVCTG